MLNLGLQFPLKGQYCKGDYLITSHVKARSVTRGDFPVQSLFTEPLILTIH